MMLCVVDANVVYSSLLTKGNSFNVFVLNDFFGKFEFIAPEYLLSEVSKHKQEIIRRANISESEFEEFFEFITNQVTFVSNLEFNDFLPKAEEILKDHKKDIPYLALALKFNCNIFSGDKKFRELCSEKVFSPKEMLEFFYNE